MSQNFVTVDDLDGIFDADYTSVAYVKQGVLVSSTGGGIGFTGGNSYVYMYGSAFGSNAISCGLDATSEGSRVIVGSTGLVTGIDFGVKMRGTTGNLSNAGEISGDTDSGVYVESAATVLSNSGTINSLFGVGIRLLSNVAGTVTLTNTGLIHGGGYSIAALFSVANHTITNSGTLSGNVILSDGIDTLNNASGLIIGDVDLGIGSDFFRNTNGHVTGTVYGNIGDDQLFGGSFDDALFGEYGIDTLVGNGGDDTLDGGDLVDTIRGGAGDDTISGGNDNDVVRGGSGADVMDGGAGIDLVSYLDAIAGVGLALDGSVSGFGDGALDTLSGFERLQGSNFNDSLTGDLNGNYLLGENGDDILNGQAGSDFIRGGLGADTMTGGAGNDAFEYLSAGHGGDTVMAFSSAAAGNNDYFRFQGSAFGGHAAGAILAPEFQS